MSNKPKIFTYTSYRLPSQEELTEINSANLRPEEIFEGLCYTIIGKGIFNTKHKSDIIESINMLINKFPNNENYEKALNLANHLQPRFKSINESNSIKGGKADKLTVKDIAKKFNVPVSTIEKQLAMGKKVEHEHTKDMNKAIEISMDHLTEFPDYYTRLEKMEKEAEKHAKKLEVNEGTKILIKRLLRENLVIENTGVDFIYQKNPELTNIGTPEEYSQYLTTIFPNSKVKDIVYHGTNSADIEGGKLRPSREGVYGEGIYVQTKQEFTGTFGSNTLSIIIDTKKPFPFHDNGKPNELFMKILGKWRETKKFYHAEAAKEEFRDNIIKMGYDSIMTEEGGGNTYYILFKPEQVHILGSSQDIEGFKHFVNKLRF